ncbi:MAG TPA: hypothetical protein DCQ31_03880 [Bacteroidales bacterium]|nr:hypothetical protein [Bacteroidales bacterium]
MFELRLRLDFLLLKQPETELKDYGKQLIGGLIGQTHATKRAKFYCVNALGTGTKIQRPKCLECT